MDADILDLDLVYQSAYLACIGGQAHDAEDRKAAWACMAQSGCRFQGGAVPFSYLPQTLSPQTQRLMQQTAETAYGILVKVMKHYQQDESYRSEFHFDPRMEQLLLLPVDYDMPLPYARLDCLCDEQTNSLVFCEFNTDASSGMFENQVALQALERTAPFKEFAAQFSFTDDRERHFQGWVQKFLDLRQQALSRRGQQPSRPHLGIVVCFDSADPDLGELSAYCRLFEQAGLPASVFDVREIGFDGTTLVGHHALVGESEVTLDSIWRFAIAVDLLTHWAEVQDFVAGVRAGAAVLIGGLSTQVVHDKQLLAVLHRPATLSFLTEAECEFVQNRIPYTAFLDSPDLDLNEVRTHPERWVIKPTDWYESINVAYGGDYSLSEWDALIEQRLAHRAGTSPWLVQEYHQSRKTPVIPLYGRQEDWTGGAVSWGSIYGLYMFAGEFSGFYLRQGPHAVIGSARQGLEVPVLLMNGSAE